MDIAQILAFTLVAALLVMSPGPNGVLIAKTVPLSGRLAGFANVAGFVTAFYLHGALAIFGISVLLVRSAELFFVVKMLGAAYLVWIGLSALYEAWRSGDSIVAPPVPSFRRRRTLARAFGEGFVTNALNPKVSMFYIAAFPQFIVPGPDTALPSLLLVTIHAGCNLVWFSAMVLLMARLTRATRSGSFRRWLKGVTGAVFIGFGIKLASMRVE